MPPQTLPIVEAALLPLLHCWFSRPSRSSRTLIVSSLASPRQAEAAERASSSVLFVSWPLSLVGSRAASSRSSSLRSLVSPLQGGQESLFFLSLTGRGYTPPRPSPNRRASKAGSPPLVVGAGFTFAALSSSSVTGSSPSQQAGKAGPVASSSSALLSCRLSVGRSSSALSVVTLLACLPVATSGSPPASGRRPSVLLLWQLRS